MSLFAFEVGDIWTCINASEKAMWTGDAEIKGRKKDELLRLQRSGEEMKSWARRIGLAIVKRKDICILGLEREQDGQRLERVTVREMEWVRVLGSSCAMAFVFTWREDKLMSQESWESGDGDSRGEVSFCKWRMAGSWLEKHRRVARPKWYRRPWKSCDFLQ